MFFIFRPCRSSNRSRCQSDVHLKHVCTQNCLVVVGVCLNLLPMRYLPGAHLLQPLLLATFLILVGVLLAHITQRAVKEICISWLIYSFQYSPWSPHQGPRCFLYFIFLCSYYKYNYNFVFQSTKKLITITLQYTTDLIIEVYLLPDILIGFLWHRGMLLYDVQGGFCMPSTFVSLITLCDRHTF